MKNRVLETAICRLRLGHVGLNKHLHRVKASPTDLCNCGQIESVEHFIMFCPLWKSEREKLFKSITSLKVQITLQNILGGGNFDTNTQVGVMHYLGEYLCNTKKINTL